jgi:hypothetical protein
MNTSLLIWLLLAIGVSFLLEPFFRKNRADKTSLLLTGFTGGAIILRAVLFLQYGYHDKEHSVLQAKSLGLASGLVVGLGIALFTHALVLRFAKPSAT